MTDDEDLLRQALASASGQRPAGESDWAAFERRLSRRPADGRRSRARWQAPLIAAAAVIAIALATTAVATGGFGAGRQATSGSVASGPVTVPIVPPVQFSGDAPGSVGTVALSFVGGKPVATLRWLLTLHDAKTSGSETSSDGSALGYVDHTTAEIQGHRYLWGAVGPNVAQIQVGAVSPPMPGDVDPGFSSGAGWTFDSGAGTAFSTPEAATARWTALGGGWHAFAVELPPDATTASVVALGPRGQMLQQREWDLVAGTHTDRPVAPNTALHQAPPLGSETGSERPEPSVSSEAPPATIRSAPLRTDPGRTSLGQTSSAAPTSGAPTTGAGAPTVATYQDQGIQAGMAALLEGRIRIVDGCLAIDDGNGNVLTPVFPSSQVGAAVPPAVLQFRGHDYNRGDSISLGGGGLDSTYPDLPAGCPRNVWFVNPST